MWTPYGLEAWTQMGLSMDSAQALSKLAHMDLTFNLNGSFVEFNWPTLIMPWDHIGPTLWSMWYVQWPCIDFFYGYCTGPTYECVLR